MRDLLGDLRVHIGLAVNFGDHAGAHHNLIGQDLAGAAVGGHVQLADIAAASDVGAGIQLDLIYNGVYLQL